VKHSSLSRQDSPCLFCFEIFLAYSGTLGRLLSTSTSLQGNLVIFSEASNFSNLAHPRAMSALNSFKF